MRYLSTLEESVVLINIRYPENKSSITLLKNARLSVLIVLKMLDVMCIIDSVEFIAVMETDSS